MKIFLDLDGVLRDWISGIYKLFDCEPIKNIGWSTLPDYVCKEYNISKSVFWERQNYYFWANLNPLPYMHQILDLLPRERTCILTSPTLNSAGGTQAWIRKYLPRFFDRKQYLIGPAKQFCASYASLLIDDNDEHVEKFRKYGGSAILFPQPWNKNSNKTGQRMEYFKEQMQTQRYQFDGHMPWMEEII